MKPYTKGKTVITLSPVDIEILKRMGMKKRFILAGEVDNAAWIANQVIRRMME